MADPVFDSEALMYLDADESAPELVAIPDGTYPGAPFMWRRNGISMYLSPPGTLDSDVLTTQFSWLRD